RPDLDRLSDQGREGRPRQDLLRLQQLRSRGLVPRGPGPGGQLHDRGPGGDRRQADAAGHLEAARRVQRRGIRPRSVHGPAQRAGAAVARGHQSQAASRVRLMAIDYAATPSPCFVLEEARLRANLELLAEVSRRSGATILCALKGFAMYGSFPLVRRYLAGVTASSLAEALLGLEEFGSEIHAYCPAYLPDDFDAIARIASHITFNSIGEYRRYRDRLRGASPGLRINPEYAE